MHIAERICFVVCACLAAIAYGDTVTLAPPEGVTTNVPALFTGDTAVEVTGPGTVKLNNANSHTGGTTLSGGTLAISGNIPAGSYSPVGLSLRHREQSTTTTFQRQSVRATVATPSSSAQQWCRTAFSTLSQQTSV